MEGFPRDINRRRLTDFLRLKYPDQPWHLHRLSTDRSVTRSHSYIPPPHNNHLLHAIFNNETSSSQGDSSQEDRPNVLIEDIGTPMTPSSFSLSTATPTNWYTSLLPSNNTPPPPSSSWKSLTQAHRYMYEKYEGIRAFWNPKKRAFFSSHGNILRVPQTIIDAMPPDLFLDGEFWCPSIHPSPPPNISANVLSFLTSGLDQVPPPKH